MVNGAKHYAFTLNNYSAEDEDRVSKCFKSGGVQYLIYGKEVSPSGTPHLQGHVSFCKKTTIKAACRELGQAHYTVARSISNSIEYCKKSGAVTEFGLPPQCVTNPGSRNELAEFMSSVKGGMVDPKELREAHPNVMARYPRYALSYVRDNKALPAIADHDLRPWQSNLVEKLSHPPNTRDVYFVIDRKGNNGKSYFAAYMERQNSRCQVMKCGKRDDMAFELREDVEILIVDVSRSSSEYLNYQFLEDVKDGRVFSPKYESYTKRFNAPHVLVMMNEEPDGTKLSEDRYINLIL